MNAPHNHEAEQVVLGSILLNPALIHDADGLTPDSFYQHQHKTIFKAMQLVASKGTPVDMYLVMDSLRRSNELDTTGGPAYLATLADIIPSISNFARYVEILEDQRKRRDMIAFASKAMIDAKNPAFSADEICADMERQVLGIHRETKKQIWVTAAEGIKARLNHLDYRSRNRTLVTGVPSGFDDLDRKTCGFQPGDLIIIAARPSMGKTALAMQMAWHASTSGHKAGIFSLEMSQEQLFDRQLSVAAQVDGHRMRTGFLSDDDWGRINRAAGDLQRADVYVDDTPSLSVDRLCSRARRLCVDKGISFLVADYLGLVQGPKTDRHDLSVGAITKALKAMGKELKIPIVALSQLNRRVDERTSKRPMMSDLRDSGEIEQDADVVMFIYRDDYYNTSEDNPKKGVAEIIIGKNRNGPTGTVELGFQKEYTRFVTLDRR